MTLTNHSEIAERARAFAGLLQILNMKLSQEATEIATRDLSEIPTSVFLESCAKLRRTGTNVRNIVAAIHQEAKALAGSGNAPTRDPISQKIVCSQCAEAYWSSTSEHAPTHTCDPRCPGLLRSRAKGTGRETSQRTCRLRRTAGQSEIPHMSSPTSRSLEECRRRGWLAEVVEKWIPQTKQKKDLWGFVDLVAITPDGRTIGIQATSGANHAARVAKIQASPKIDSVLNAGWGIEVWSYTRRKVKRGGKAVRWVLREERVTLADHKTEAFNPDTSGLIPFLRGELRDATKTKG